MSVLFILGSVQALFLCFLISSRGSKLSLSQVLLIIWLLTITAKMFFYWVSFSKEIIFFDLMLIFWGIESTHGPLVLLYTLSATDNQFRLRKVHLLHFAVYILLLLILFYFQYFTTNTITVLNGYLIFREGAPAILMNYILLIRLITILYFIFSAYIIHQKKKERVLYFSNFERVNLLWLRHFVIGVLVGYIILYASIPNLMGFKELTDIQIASIETLSCVLFTFFAGYVNFMHQADLVDNSLASINSVRLDESEVTDNRYKRAGLSPEKSLELLNNLLEFMETHKPYLNNKLTLRDLADELNTSTNHLSQLINERLQKNFFTFINEYRVREFNKKITLGYHDSFTLTGVALDCGFSSRSSFYTVFKKLKGTTPAEYIAKGGVGKEIMTGSQG